MNGPRYGNGRGSMSRSLISRRWISTCIHMNDNHRRNTNITRQTGSKYLSDVSSNSCFGGCFFSSYPVPIPQNGNVWMEKCIHGSLEVSFTTQGTGYLLSTHSPPIETYIYPTSSCFSWLSSEIHNQAAWSCCYELWMLRVQRWAASSILSTLLVVFSYLTLLVSLPLLARFVSTVTSARVTPRQP